MQITQTKKSIKIPIIIALSVVLAIVVAVASFFLIQKSNLSRSLKNLDVENEQTVIRAMKYGSKDADVVLEIAQKYLEADMKSDCVRLCLYAIQYLGEKEKGIALVEKACENKEFVKTIENEQAELSEFDTLTQFQNDSYGVADGIYTEFLGGYAKARISPIIPIDIYATDSGAYFLDSTDSFIKHISKDGSKLKIAISNKAEEFVLFESQLYYIDQNGIPYGKAAMTLADGEFAMGLSVDGEAVSCTVYNHNYEPLRKLILE